jgi:hypothetical protein
VRVVCPHVGPIDLRVRDALDVATGRWPGSSLPHQWDAIDVSQADTAYTRLLATLWALGEPFAIVEHDIVVHPGTLVDLEACTHTWCAFPYQLGRFTTAGLGCTKFSAQLIRAHPHAVAETWAEQTEAHPRGHWCNLDDRLTRVLMRAGAVRHEHAPVVEHLNPTPSHGCS